MDALTSFRLQRCHRPIVLTAILELVTGIHLWSPPVASIRAVRKLHWGMVRYTLFRKALIVATRQFNKQTPPLQPILVHPYTEFGELLVAEVEANRQPQFHSST